MILLSSGSSHCSGRRCARALQLHCRSAAAASSTALHSAPPTQRRHFPHRSQYTVISRVLEDEDEDEDEDDEDEDEDAKDEDDDDDDDDDDEEEEEEEEHADSEAEAGEGGQ